MLRAIAPSVIYAITPPPATQLGFLWQDNSVTPAVLKECISISPLTYQAVAGGGGSGTVTSIAAGDGVSVSPSPITATGTISLKERFADTLLLMGG